MTDILQFVQYWRQTGTPTHRAPLPIRHECNRPRAISASMNGWIS